MSRKFKKSISAFVGITTAVMMLGGVAVVPAPASAQTTIEDLQAQITALLATIAGLQAQVSSLSGGGGGTGCYAFTRDLNLGMDNPNGSDVVALQDYLTGTGHFTFSGGSTGFFGPITQSATAAWQAANSVSPPAGYFGPLSRTKYNSICTPTTPPTTTPPTTTPPTEVEYSGDVTVSSPAQPLNNIAPSTASVAAARVPFTKVTFTAGPGGATVDSITVERGGFSANGDISGAVLINEDGVQLGVEKSLNSNNQAILTEDFSIPPNSSRTLTIGANMATSAGAGNVLTLSVVGVSVKGGNVIGSLPITGAAHTVNVSTAIGTVSITALNHSGGTKDIGTEGFTFSSFRVTNGSAEKVRLGSIRWNQTGSAGTDDLTNVVTWVEGTEYPATPSSDSKYYTSLFAGGIVLDKGNSAEIRVMGGLEDGSARTIIFDIHRKTDLAITGETFGFGITPPAGSGTAGATNNVFTAGTPWMDGATWTIGGGSLIVAKATTVAAQNIAENVSGQILGGYTIEVKGEEVSVGQIDFFFDISGAATAFTAADMTNVVLENEGGTIVAGPVDGTVSSGSQRVRFTDTVIFPVEKGLYTLKGKIGTDVANNQVITASTTPGTDWTTVTGQTSSDTITPSPAGAITANQVTVKSGALIVNVSSIPLAQTIVAGGQFTFATFEFDTSQSGDDVRVSSIPVEIGGTGYPNNLTNCGLYDGTASLTTGSNAINPTAWASGTTFTLDSPYVFPKGTMTPLDLNCDTSATTTGTSYRIGLDDSTSAGAGQMAPTAEGSGETITETINDSVGQLITLTTGGTFTVVDDDSPGYNLVVPGTEVVLLKLKFAATNEDINIKKVAFQLGDTASNSPLNLVGRQLTLWNGTTQIGTAPISMTGGEDAVGTANFATSSPIADGNFVVPRSGSLVMTVKGVIAGISADEGPMQRSGDLLEVTWDAHDADSTTKNASGTYGTGVNGGTDIVPSTTSDVAQTSGVGRRVMKAYPTFTKVDLSSEQRKLIDGAGKILYRFKVSPTGGEIAFYKFTFNVSSSTTGRATTSLFSLYAYNDSAFSQADTTFSADGLLNSGQCFNGSADTGAGGSGPKGDQTGDPQVPIVEIYMEKTQSACNTSTTTYKLSSDRWFELRATVATVDTATSDPKDVIEVRLEGDAAFAGSDTSMLEKAKQGDNNSVDAYTHDDLIWSPRSTSTSAAIGDEDWTNGYLVPGLPTTNMPIEVITEP